MADRAATLEDLRSLLTEDDPTKLLILGVDRSLGDLNAATALARTVADRLAGAALLDEHAQRLYGAIEAIERVDRRFATLREILLSDHKAKRDFIEQAIAEIHPKDEDES